RAAAVVGVDERTAWLCGIDLGLDGGCWGPPRSGAIDGRDVLLHVHADAGDERVTTPLPQPGNGSSDAVQQVAAARPARVGQATGDRESTRVELFQAERVAGQG